MLLFISGERSIIGAKSFESASTAAEIEEVG
jgi:TATA-box binding protein (TBP) (component of TFIID and TFIIIB)